MYKGKPLIMFDRPWWRHPMFPWGWYSLIRDVPLSDIDECEVDGSYAPVDGGGGKMYWDISAKPRDGGTIIDPDKCEVSDFLNDIFKEMYAKSGRSGGIYGANPVNEGD